MIRPSQLGRFALQAPPGQSITRVRDSRGEEVAEPQKTHRVIVETWPGRTYEVSFAPAP